MYQSLNWVFLCLKQNKLKTTTYNFDPNPMYMRLRNSLRKILKFFRVKRALDDYYYNLDPSELPISILRILQQVFPGPVYTTNREIKAFESLFQSSPTQLKTHINGKLVGKRKQPKWSKKYEVYFFKKILTSTKLFIQAHFINKEVFYIQYKFILSTELEVIAMKQSLQEKYGVEDLLFLNNLYLVDHSQNQLYIDIKNYNPTKLYYVEVKFISGNPHFKREILSIVNKIKNQESSLKYQDRSSWSVVF